MLQAWRGERRCRGRSVVLENNESILILNTVCIGLILTLFGKSKSVVYSGYEVAP